MDDLLPLTMRRPRTRWAGHPLVLLAETGSTNDDARMAAQTGAPQGHTIVADAQRAGRGRRGNAWHSPAGENVYLSMVLRPRLPPSAAPVITLAVGLAVADTIASLAPARSVTIKWPNDVRIDGRKVAGVLVEGSVRAERLAFAVVGVGINVRGTSLPAELASRATSLRLATGEIHSRAALIETLLASLEARIDALSTEGSAAMIAEVAARCDTIGTQVCIDGIDGVAEGIDPNGALLVRGNDGTLHPVRAGELRTPASTR